MSDCKLTDAVRTMLNNGGEIHSELVIRMPDGHVFKVHKNGDTEYLWTVSDKDAEKISFNFTDI